MKHLYILCFSLSCAFGFSQEVIIEDEKPSDLLLAVNYKGFDDVYNRLESISKNINETSVILKRIDQIRQGFLVIDTKSIGQSFEGLKIDARPSLNLELQRVMFTGNSINPFRRTPIVINQ